MEFASNFLADFPTWEWKASIKYKMLPTSKALSSPSRENSQEMKILNIFESSAFQRD